MTLCIFRHNSIGNIFDTIMPWVVELAFCALLDWQQLTKEDLCSDRSAAKP